MKIGKKIISATLSGIVIMAALGVMSIYSMMAIHAHLEMIHDHSLQIEEQANLQIQVGKLLMPVNDYIITANPKYSEDYQKQAQELSELLIQLKSDKYLTNEEKLLIEQFESKLKGIQTSAGKIFAMPIQAGNPEAAKLMEEMDYLHGYPSISLAEKLHELGRQQIDDEAKKSRSVYSSLVTAVIVCILLGLTIAFIAGYLISKNISASVNTLVKTAETVASGDLEMVIDVSGKDEVGILALAFKNMV
jgi:methyl-accepting chemotaxis protein